jgi:hypothetical protein
MIKSILLGLGCSIAALVLIFFGLLAHFNINHWRAQKAQDRYQKTLSAHYAGAYQPVNEVQFTDIPAPQWPARRLNEVRFLATHNSYKQYGSAPGKLMIRLVTNKHEADSLRYAYKQLTSQLEAGIRSFEIDVRLRGATFEAVHVPLVDNMSNVMNLEGGLRELKLFSDHNPRHFPVITLLEFKDDWTFADPKIQKIGENEFRVFDRMLEEIFGEKLYRPAELLAAAGAASLPEAVRTGWPAMDRMMGRFIFIVHSGNFAETYYAMDTSLASQRMFIAASREDAPYAAIILHNDPDVAEIRALIDQGFIVRTRMDENLTWDEARYRRAMESGAQLLTSDLTIGRADLNAPYTWLTGEGITITID